MKRLLLCLLVLLGLAGCSETNTPEAIDAAREECAPRGGIPSRWIAVGQGLDTYTVKVVCADGTLLKFTRRFKEE